MKLKKLSEDRRHLLSNLSFPQLKLHGGPLGSDSPVIKGISIKLDASAGPGVISLKDLGFDIDVDFSNPKAQYFKLRGHLAPFNLASPTLPTISEKKVSLDADLKRSPDGKHLTIDNFKVNSNALTLAANGKLDQSGKNKIFQASGTMAPDLRLVAEYLKKTGKGPIEIAGKKATPFTIKLVSKGDRWEDPLKHLNFSGAFHVDSVKAYGLSLTPKDVPIRLANASADAEVESPANGGMLAMQPIVDMRNEPYVLSFKENIDILKEVKVTQGLVDGLLASLHPLFNVEQGVQNLFKNLFKKSE